MVAVLVDGEPALRVQGQAVGTRLAVLRDVRARVAAGAANTPSCAVPTADRSCCCWDRRTADSHAVGHPDRPLGELEAFRQLPQLRVGRDDGVDCRIEAHHFDDSPRAAPRPRARRAAMELELRVVQEDEVGRRLGDRPVDAEQRELDLLAGLDVAADDQTVLPRSSPSPPDRRFAPSDAAARRPPTPRRSRRPASRTRPSSRWCRRCPPARGMVRRTRYQLKPRCPWPRGLDSVDGVERCPSRRRRSRARRLSGR